TPQCNDVVGDAGDCLVDDASSARQTALRKCFQRITQVIASDPEYVGCTGAGLAAEVGQEQRHLGRQIVRRRGGARPCTRATHRVIGELPGVEQSGGTAAMRVNLIRELLRPGLSVAEVMTADLVGSARYQSERRFRGDAGCAVEITGIAEAVTEYDEPIPATLRLRQRGEQREGQQGPARDRAQHDEVLVLDALCCTAGLALPARTPVCADRSSLMSVRTARRVPRTVHGSRSSIRRALVCVANWQYSATALLDCAGR